MTGCLYERAKILRKFQKRLNFKKFFRGCLNEGQYHQNNLFREHFVNVSKK